MVAFHPERGALPGEIRWVIPDGQVPVLGVVTSAPGEFGELIASGVLSVIAEPAAIRTTLAAGEAWPAWVNRVRPALAEALTSSDGWRTSGEGEIDDELVTRITNEVLTAGPTADFVRSHGGVIVLEDVSDGVVTVAMTGTCAGCPAAGFTLHARLERELRLRVPGFRAIRSSK